MKRHLGMLHISFFLALAACASGPGQAPDEETGSAGLSLQLAGLEDGEIYASNDGYVLTFTHFAMAFSGMSLGEAEVDEAFSADFFDEEVVDLVEIEEVAPGEYDEVALTMGTAGSGGNARFVKARNLKNAETTPGALDGNSAFLEAEAVKGSDHCVLQVVLQADGETVEVDPGDSDVEVEAGEEAEVLVEVDPNQVFAGVDLGGLCQSGGVVTISAADNADLADRIAANLGGAFALGSSEGHHDH